MLTQILVWLNAMTNVLAGVLLSPIAWLPGWLSLTLVAIVTGCAMLVIFKHTSNQAAIKQTRNRIKANLLALSLFKDNLRVGFACQGGLLLGAVKLLVLAAVPMAVMVLPTCLLLGQLALWYQHRPLRVGEEAVVTVKLGRHLDDSAANARLESGAGITSSAGPVRIRSKEMVCWTITGTEPGTHLLKFDIAGQTVTKQIAIGNGFMMTNPKRPGWNLVDVLMYPLEAPFAPESPVQSIEVEFPERASWFAGSHSWLVYWFAASMVAAFAASPLLKVNL